MFTSDKSTVQGRRHPVTGAYLLETVCCALFGFVYELFSHGVYSYYMICAFAFPLLLGVMPFSILQKSGKLFCRGIAADLIHAGIAALTMGSIVRGALDIYGTSNPLTVWYWITGGILTAGGWLWLSVAKPGLHSGSYSEPSSKEPCP